jgi:RecJ-like exonuclease
MPRSQVPSRRCTFCGGSGRRQLSCTLCGGVGRRSQMKSVRVWSNGTYVNQMRHEWVNCMSCIGMGRQWVGCTWCHGTGRKT